MVRWMLEAIFKRAKALFSKIVGEKKVEESTESSLHPVQAELAEVIGKARGEAEAAAASAQAIKEDMQFVIDEADQTMRLVQYIKPDIAEDLLDIWSSVGERTSRVRFVLEPLRSDTGGTVSSTSTNTIVISGAYLSGGLYSDRDGFEDAWMQYEDFARRPGLLSDVEKLLREFGFDKPPFAGKKSALEQFHLAHQSFSSPVTRTNPISTSLIPLRECIQSVIDGLLRMRPNPERAKNQRAKVLSIGEQLGRDSLPHEAIEKLAEEWQKLNDELLSPSKDSEVSREAWLSSLNRGTAFLHSLLRELDGDKLRR